MSAQHEILERLAHWVLCAASLVLWLSLDSDWENALWLAFKAPGSRYWIDSLVRWDKVTICLSWSVLIFLLVAYCYGMAARALIALLASVLLVQVADALLKINLDAIPYVYLVMKYSSLAILWLIAPMLISAIFAYKIWSKSAFVQTDVRIATAITLGTCAMMLWVGLFDVVYPGICWR